MGRLGVGIVGLGGISKLHVDGYKRNQNVEIKAICDIDKTLMARKAGEFGLRNARQNEDYRSLLEAGDIDLVTICVPNHLHAEISLAALRAGKHVLCEKPLCVSMEQCEELVAAVGRTGLKFMTGQEVRYVPKFKAVKRLIELGELGDLFMCESEYVDNKLRVVHGWRQELKKVGSWLLEAGCHPIDILRWMAGDVAEVAGYAKQSVREIDFPGDDCHVAILKFASGCLGRIAHSAGCKRPYHIGLSVYGTKGTFNADAGLFLEKVEGLTDFMSFPVPTAGFHPIEDEVEDFITCILEDKKPDCDVMEGAKTIATCLAIEQSIRENRFVAVRKDFA